MGSFCLDFTDWLVSREERTHVKVCLSRPPGCHGGDSWYLSRWYVCSGNVGCIVTSWLCVVGISVPPALEVASHLLALMGYSPGIETLAVVLRDPLQRVMSLLCHATGPGIQYLLRWCYCSPLLHRWDIGPLSMVMQSHDTEAHQLQTEVKDHDFLQFF